MKDKQSRQTFLAVITTLKKLVILVGADGTLTDSNTQGQSRPWSDSYEGVPHIPHISKNGDSPSDVIQCCIQDTPFLGSPTSL